MTKVLISGGGGLVGTHLSRKLIAKGFKPAILSRNKRTIDGINSYYWNYETGEIEDGAIDDAEIIIHLAGKNISDQRWTAKNKRLIIDSRVKTAELLFRDISDRNIKPRAFISASAVGYYGAISSEKIFLEPDENADDFIGTTCKLWEEAADKFHSAGIRTVKLRSGIVLAKDAGAYKKMTAPFKFGVGAIPGDGKQYLPWIHIDDLCDMFIKAVEDNSMQGSYNAVAPEHISYKQFIDQVSGIVRKPLLKLQIPPVFLRLGFGQMSEILLSGSRVSSEKIEQAGYVFQYPDLRSALHNFIAKDTN